MEPHLNHGNIALFRRRQRVKQGDVVLVEHPEFGKIIKQVSAVGDEGNVHLKGTSRHSTSEARLGSVSHEAVLGVMVRKLKGAR